MVRVELAHSSASGEDKPLLDHAYRMVKVSRRDYVGLCRAIESKLRALPGTRQQVRARSCAFMQQPHDAGGTGVAGGASA